MIMTSPPFEPVVEKPPAKSVVIEKAGGGKWSMEFSPDLRITDINHLSRLLRIEFLRSKRRSKRERTIEGRKQENGNG